MTVSLTTATEKMGQVWRKVCALAVAVVLTACSIDTPQDQIKLAPRCRVEMYDASALIKDNNVRRISSDATGSFFVAVEDCGDVDSAVDVVIAVQPIGIVSGGRMVKLGALRIYPEAIPLPITPKDSIMVYVFVNGKMLQYRVL